MKKGRLKMNIEELKQTIEQRTGVPASLLKGETAEENIAQAKALLAYKRESEQQRPKTATEQFSDWFSGYMGERDRQTAAAFGLHYEAPETDPAGAALADIAEAVRVEGGGYPIVRDGGQVDTSKMPDPRPAAEQFADWLGQQTAFDPFKDADGWKRLL